MFFAVLFTGGRRHHDRTVCFGALLLENACLDPHSGIYDFRFGSCGKSAALSGCLRIFYDDSLGDRAFGFG